jgi:isopentenyl-diphosphate delta-isomerase
VPPPGDEPFETFTESGVPLGLRRRADVHRHGDWHRAANVLLCDGRGRLWLQRRAAGKDLWPLAWDVSVGEHLVPGETFLDGALRGLAEELGVRGVPLTPLGGVVRASFAIPADGVRDNELQQSFTGVWDGTVAPDEREVAEVRLVERAALLAALRDGHERFTPWLRARIGLLGW